MEREGLVEPFDTLYATHARGLHAYLLSRTGSDDTAADLLQDTFVRVWRHLEDLLPMCRERRRFWLFRVARNLTYDHYRRREVRRGEWLDDDPDLQPAENAGGDQRSRWETAQDIDAAIDRLPEKLRSVLVMHSLGGMTSTEISGALGRPAGTVRYQLARARRLLAEMMGLTARATVVGEAKVRL